MVRGGKCPYQWTLTFFGLPARYRKDLHQEIFTLVYYGQGFTHDDVYNMPVYLRRFYSESLLKENASPELISKSLAEIKAKEEAEQEVEAEAEAEISPEAFEEVETSEATLVEAEVEDEMEATRASAANWLENHVLNK